MKPAFFLIIPVFIISCSTLTEKGKFTVKSPDKSLEVIVKIDKSGIPVYSVTRDKQIVLENSRLGIIREDADFSKDLKIRKRNKSEIIDDDYTLLSGKRRHCSYHANKRSVIFVNDQDEEMEVIFQVSNDGVAFCYRFGKPTEEIKKIFRENTSFNFPEGSKAWLHPHTDAKTGWCNVEPCYEMHYHQGIDVGTPAPFKAGWSLPALFLSNKNNTWVLVTESGLESNYCGSRLSQQSPDGEYLITFPQEGERTSSEAPFKPQSALPWQTPWRVLVIGSLKEIVENTLVTDLARPSAIADAEFVLPGKASWSWALLKDNSVVYDVQKKFIDYAAAMEWEYCLIDVNWDQNIGYDKIQELVNHAKSKNIGIILWYNSSGSWNTTTYSPKNIMCDPGLRRKEFEKISRMGVKGIKVDFWGGDGQSMIEYYHDLLGDAAKFNLMVNCHGATIPRGWERTYPNLVTMESVRGFEYVTFEQSNADSAARHCSMLPFTRNAIGPMDFTPVCFSGIPRIQRKTSNAFELALAVLFQSGIQHYAEIPEGMNEQPGFIINFMKQIPDYWEDVKFIDGFPARYVIIARKSDKGWFVAGINSLKEQVSFNLDLSDLNTSGTGFLITDGETDRSFSRKNVTLQNGRFKLDMKPSGGFVMYLDQ
jgi:alpha-glucosidase